MASSQPRRNSAAKGPRLTKAERRRQLLGQAKQLFLRQGYHATTAAHIAEAAGVAESVLYRHFDGKKALFREILGEVRAATLDRWTAEAAAPADPLAQLHAIADAYLAAARSHAEEIRILHRALLEAGDEEIITLLRAFYVNAEALLARVIAEGQQSGVFRRSLDARVGAWELIRSALGYTLTLPMDVPLYQEPDYLTRAVDCLLHCLLKTDV